MHTWHIHIEGQVQGVGFRPFIFSLARQQQLQGWVNNTVDGVHIVFNATADDAVLFKGQIMAQAPVLSKITGIRLSRSQPASFNRFEILHSQGQGEPQLLLTPDFAICPDCRRELTTPGNRRAAYPFITCTHCGPRFSIVHTLPYDREHTRMDTFQMCPACLREYEDPLDRRYYSQTNSCQSCGITQLLYDADRQPINQDPEEIIEEVVHHWNNGKIIAIKGIGGYLLTCDASQEQAIDILRQKKDRPSKPFALMVPNSDHLKDYWVDPKELQALEDHVSPILLLGKRATASISQSIAPGLDQVGVMLPYTPLFELLLMRFGRPIIATSGNKSHSPIVFQDQVALDQLVDIADYLLINNREIVVPQDDSVIKYSPTQKQKIILRRSRGLAPTFIRPDLVLTGQSILAMGAMLKSTFSLLHRQNLYISQYLGDLENFDTQQNYQHSLRHFLRLFQTQPELVLIDQHPTYPSSQLGAEWAQAWEVPVKAIQHHKAHFGALLGEHNLVDIQHPILGVIWDGTGLGEDGQIWGGEFFVYEDFDFERVQHFDYFDFILGDKMPKEPRISALSACWKVEGATAYLKNKFSSTEWQVYSKLLDRGSPLQTSSIGRLFDAVASLLDVSDSQSYEGEAAMRLEAMASAYCQRQAYDFPGSYWEGDLPLDGIPTNLLLHGIILDLQAGEAKDYIAAKFHFSLVESIEAVANQFEIKRIGFSGGVFQNSLLVDLILHHLQEKFELYFHQQLSPNDENISFGQVMVHQIEQKKETFVNHKLRDHVLSDSR